MFELEDGKTATSEICDSHGNIEGKLEASRLNGKITAVKHGVKKPWVLCLRNIHRFSSAPGAECADSREGLLLSMSGDAEHITVELF